MDRAPPRLARPRLRHRQPRPTLCAPSTHVYGSLHGGRAERGRARPPRRALEGAGRHAPGASKASSSLLPHARARPNPTLVRPPTFRNSPSGGGWPPGGAGAVSTVVDAMSARDFLILARTNANSSARAPRGRELSTLAGAVTRPLAPARHAHVFAAGTSGRRRGQGAAAAGARARGLRSLVLLRARALFLLVSALSSSRTRQPTG